MIRAGLLCALGVATLGGLWLVDAIDPELAHASVTLRQVTPDNVDQIDGIDVSATTDERGVTLVLTLAPAAVDVYPPRIDLGDGTEPLVVEFDAASDPTAGDAEPAPRRATIRVVAEHVATASVSVMRDDGLVGHRYDLRVADWFTPTQ